MLIQNRVNEFVRETSISVEALYVQTHCAREMSGKISGIVIDVDINLEDI
jgi:hypothetical protein